ncbi:MAG: DUF262 domain-containing protein [Chloroflexi bacterium]|nr:DUF262 domain-containing protein [Chloroflexota bacterium]
MRVSTILDHIDSGDMALPKFQRGYVWNRDQVRGLMDSMYRGHPVGSLLVWVTQAEGADHRGSNELAPGVVRLLLDGQQRITSLYGIIRGKPPEFFDGNARAFSDLYFNIESEEFRFYQAQRMKGDPFWIEVSALLRQGNAGIGQHIRRLSQAQEVGERLGEYIGRLNKVLGVRDTDLHVEEVTGADKTVDVVVDIFNRVNSGGTKLSQGDLALAKICGSWPEGRERMQESLAKWRQSGYHFSLDWLLRVLNGIVTGEARFIHLHDRSTVEIKDGLARAERAIDASLNLISGRFGLDHDRVLFGRYALPVMARYIDRRGGHLSGAKERDRLLYWYFQSGMWGRFSGSTESTLNVDFEATEELDGAIDRLLEQLRLWHGSLQVEPAHFRGWSLGARFYPVLYALTRVGEAQDWGTGLPLKRSLLGKMNSLEVHHIFPKSLLYEHGYKRPEVNAIANFCYLTKDTNLRISARPPSEYFAEIEQRLPGSLESQWIPLDRELWQTENYPQFLEVRQRLLAEAANALLDELLQGTADIAAPLAAEILSEEPPEALKDVPGGIGADEEEKLLQEINEWLQERGLPQGEVELELSDLDSGTPLAILDLAWPNGLQEGLSQPVALLLDEPQETLQIANDCGFRHFTEVAMFKRYAETEILSLAAASDLD